MAEGRTKWPPVKDDWFVEPGEATRFLLRHEYFTGGIWDPACGQGNIVEACLLDGKEAVGSDIVERVTPRPSWFIDTYDFLTPSGGTSYWPNIITNAPYGRAKLCEAFIRKALSLNGLVKAAFFVSQKFLFSETRLFGLYRDLPPTRIYPVVPRPSCPPGEFLKAGGKASGGVENFVWLIYDLADPKGYIEWCLPSSGSSGVPVHHVSPGTP